MRVGNPGIHKSKHFSNLNNLWSWGSRVGFVTVHSTDLSTLHQVVLEMVLGYSRRLYIDGFNEEVWSSKHTACANYLTFLWGKRNAVPTVTYRLNNDDNRYFIYYNH